MYKLSSLLLLVSIHLLLIHGVLLLHHVKVLPVHLLEKLVLAQSILDPLWHRRLNFRALYLRSDEGDGLVEGLGSEDIFELLLALNNGLQVLVLGALGTLFL